MRKIITSLTAILSTAIIFGGISGAGTKGIDRGLAGLWEDMSFNYQEPVSDRGWEIGKSKYGKTAFPVSEDGHHCLHIGGGTGIYGLSYSLPPGAGMDGRLMKIRYKDPGSFRLEVEMEDIRGRDYRIVYRNRGPRRLYRSGRDKAIYYLGNAYRYETFGQLLRDLDRDSRVFLGREFYSLRSVKISASSGDLFIDHLLFTPDPNSPEPRPPLDGDPTTEGSGYLLTRLDADQDYIYLICEEAGRYRFREGRIKVFDHDHIRIATLDSVTLSSKDSEITATCSNRDYLYLGNSLGEIVQVNKNTFEQTGRYDPGIVGGSRFITGIVDMEDGYIYATTYFGEDRFLKIDPATMEVVASSGALDSTHALAEDGRFLYSITCNWGEPLDEPIRWGRYFGRPYGGMVMVLDTQTMEGYNIHCPDVGELTSGLAVHDGFCYFSSTDLNIYKIHAGSGEIAAVSGTTTGDDVNRLIACGNRLYVNIGISRLRTNGYKIYDLSDLSLIEHRDPDRDVYDICLSEDTLYVSFGTEVTARSLDRTGYGLIPLTMPLLP